MTILGDHPMMGRSRDDLSPALRSFVFGDYVTYYYADTEAVTIARVLHGRRNVEPDLFG